MVAADVQLRVKLAVVVLLWGTKKNKIIMIFSVQQLRTSLFLRQVREKLQTNFTIIQVIVMYTGNVGTYI